MPNFKKMNKLLISILTLMTLFSFNPQNVKEKFNCIVFKFKSYQEQADTLVSFMTQAQNSNLTEKVKLERKFFCAFPNSFKAMQEIFGFDDVKGEAPLYNYPNGYDVIEYFGKLNSIPKDKYYEKYININVNGIWEADNIVDAFGFSDRILNDTENTCASLNKRTDNEIISVFRFIFDGPHPINETNKEIYNQLLPKIKKQNERLGKLLSESYKQLMDEYDGH